MRVIGCRIRMLYLMDFFKMKNKLEVIAQELDSRLRENDGVY